MSTPHRRIRRLTISPSFLALLAFLSASNSPLASAQVAHRQTPPGPIAPMSGWTQCVVTVSGPGYANRVTHSWVLAGGAPTEQGAIRVHSATWSAAGQSTHKETKGSQTIDASWTIDAPAVSAPISSVIRASDGRLLIKSWHSQLRARNAITCSQQQTINGRALPPTPIGLEAFEWAFPVLEDSATKPHLIGSSTTPTTGSVGPMQPAGARGTAACSWDLARSATVAPTPLPAVQ